MSEIKSPTKAKSNPKANRKYQSDSMSLQALRLIAAPKPEDDLTDDELGVFLKKNRFPTEMIQSIIETVKSM